MDRMKIANYEAFVLSHLEIDLQQVNRFYQASVKEVTAINFAKVHELVFKTSCLLK